MKSKYFKIQELVSKAVYEKYGEKSWEFIDERIIKILDLLREHFDKPITVNNWIFGGNLHQRGLRANKDEIVKNKSDYYISQHCLGKAVDLNVKGMTAQEVYEDILKNKGKFPLIARIENIKNTPTWVHIDVANVNEFKIFNA